jgi:hypothetical protein
MRFFIFRLFKLYLIILLLTYPFKFLIEKQEQALIIYGNDKNFIKWSGFVNFDSCNTIFLGSSKIYCSIRPLLFDSITGLKSYNLGTGSQSIVESFYYLKQASEIKNIKNVILDLHLSSFQYVDLMHVRRNMQYLDKKIKRDLYINSGLAKNLFCDLIPILEYSKYLQKIPNAIMYFINKEPNKKVHIATNYQNTWERGFENAQINDTVSSIEFKKQYFEKNLANNATSYPNMCFLDSIISFCEVHKIHITLTNIPSGSWVNDTKNCTLFFEGYLKKYKNSHFFYNFPKLENTDVRSDEFHINNIGADKITHSLGTHYTVISSKSNQTHQGSN